MSPIPEALWSQNSGVEFSAAEDRRLIGAIWTNPGVLNGLTVTPGTGLAVNISAGRCVIPDGDGGSYLAYFDSVTSNLEVDSNSGSPRTDGVYVVVDDPGDGIADIVVVPSDTPVPNNPYVKIATVTVPQDASLLTTSNINNLIKTDPVDPRYALNARFTYGTGAPPATLSPGYVYMQHD